MSIPINRLGIALVFCLSSTICLDSPGIAAETVVATSITGTTQDIPKGSLVECVSHRHRQAIVSGIAPKRGQLVEYCSLDFDSQLDEDQGLYLIFRSGNKYVLYAIAQDKQGFSFVNYASAEIEDSKLELNDKCESNGGISTMNRMEEVFRWALNRNQWASFIWKKQDEPQIPYFERACAGASNVNVVGAEK